MWLLELLLFMSSSLPQLPADCPPLCRTPEEKLWSRYTSFERTECDICEHLATLRMYASRVEHVTEVGVRNGISMWGMLQGLHDAPKRYANKVYRAYDIASFMHEREARSLASQLDIDFDFQRVDILKTDLADTDLLFIDTLHAYPQLRAELHKHAHHARQYIILHDTSVDGNESECVRYDRLYGHLLNLEQSTCEVTSERVGFTLTEIKVGLWPAVQEFLASRREWSLTRRYTHNNGLTVLERVVPTHTSRHAKCELNLLHWHGPDRWTLVPARILDEHMHIMDEVSQRPSAWALTRLAIIALFFVLPLQQLKYSTMLDTTSKDVEMIGRKNLMNALELDQNQPIGLLAYANYLCQDWRDFTCNNSDQDVAETSLRVAVSEHGLWEAQLILGALLIGRGAVQEACEALLQVLRLESDNPQVIDFLRKALRYIGDRDDARDLQRRVDELGEPSRKTSLIPLSAPYWESVLCWRLVE